MSCLRCEPHQEVLMTHASKHTSNISCTTRSNMMQRHLWWSPSLFNPLFAPNTCVRPICMRSGIAAHAPCAHPSTSRPHVPTPPFSPSLPAPRTLTTTSTSGETPHPTSNMSANCAAGLCLKLTSTGETEIQVKTRSSPV